ncbi:MAG: NAD(P)-dependent oxidoreductase, partial [Acidimicrobiia bacterium]|nr:NAD(P)-dependent oxidoreductase [Acidimicrobiia bacterium]
FEVSLFDVSAASLEQFSESVAAVASSPADAARAADLACIVVFDDAQTIEVVCGSTGVLTTMQPGSVVTIHSTISPETLRLLADAGTQVGVAVIDAGISGGETGSNAGTLLTMVGGSEDVVALASPALMAFSKEIIHAGELGAGLALKLARNATGYICMAAVHEAMQIATGAGIALSVLQHTIAETGVFDQALSPFMLGGPSPLTDNDPQSLRELLLHLQSLGEKDLDQALNLAAELGEDLPVTTATRQSFHSVTRL